ncbi:MAG: helix-turn-helix domain-containing protein [Gemmatimonadetes bacterium]|nr:helix-turn-helix domain-containing protein [Gemmatimonadota bacterium]
MICEECGAKATVDRHAVRRYELGGVPHVELHGIEVTLCPACGDETIGIPRLAHLHRVIAHAFVEQRRMLAPVEIRFLRKHVGLSSVAFAQRMGVTRETVSRWETGAQPMGAVADRLLRLLVVTHEPSESYAVDDLLSTLNDEQAPARLASLAVKISKEQGWRPLPKRDPLPT